MRSRLANLVALLLMVGLVASACGSSKKSSSSNKTTTTAERITATLAGSGSTFQKSFDEAVIEAFKKQQPNITISYGGGGSGKGKTDLAAGVDQWGYSTGGQANNYGDFLSDVTNANNGILSSMAP